MSFKPSLLRILSQTIKPQPHLRATASASAFASPFSSAFKHSPRPSYLQRQIQSPFKRQSRFNSTRQNQSHTSNSHSRQGQNSSSSGSSSSSSSSSKEPSGLSARLKKLTREYGWAALGVYLTLSALDFPFCFAAVRLLGVERIGHFEHVALGYVKGVFGKLWPSSKPEPSPTSSTESDSEIETNEGESENQGEASTSIIFSRQSKARHIRNYWRNA